MVKKRLFFLVFLLVASTLVSSEHEDGDEDGYQGIVAYDANGNVAPGMSFLLTTEEDKGVNVFGDNHDDDQGNQNEGGAQQEGGAQPDNGDEDDHDMEDGIVDMAAETTTEEHHEDEDENKDPGFDVIKVLKKRRRKVLKTTTYEVHEDCEDTDFIKNARQHCIDNPPDGFEAHECHFYVQNDECDWALKCAKTVTEAPSEQEAADAAAAAAAALEEKDEIDSGESNSAESCEPKKKIKFENCFLKIRGLIKKKKPKRCD